MKKISSLSTSLLLLTSCVDNTRPENEETNVIEPNNNQSSQETEEQQENETNNSEQEENISEDSYEEDLLDKYSAEEIEYARVWLEIKGNMDIEELIVSYISEGEQVYPYDADSVVYTEDVVLLAGEGGAGSPVIIYSSNGDGTINLYDIPSHWPSYKQIDESMEEYTRNIIENTEEVYIDPGNDEEVEGLIQKIQIMD